MRTASASGCRRAAGPCARGLRRRVLVPQRAPQRTGGHLHRARQHHRWRVAGAAGDRLARLGRTGSTPTRTCGVGCLDRRQPGQHACPVAHLRCDFFSDVLGLSTSMTVLLPQQTADPDRHGRPPQHRPATGAVPVARPERRRHDLAAPHVDRALRRPARARRGDAPGAPQLLHRRGVRRPLLDVPLRGAPAAGRHVLPPVRRAAGTPSSPACRWAATGR